MYAYAWKQGLKTTYYLRSRPATRIASATSTATVSTTTPSPTPPSPGPGISTPASVADDVTCSLENPETCEACQ